mgnify:FL=1
MKEEIRVVHACPLGTGGITSMVLNICEHLDRSKINFDYLTYRNQHEYNEDRALALGGKKLVADNSSARNSISRIFLKFYNVYRILKKSETDIFHINASSPYDTLAGIAAKIAGVNKVIVHSHNANSSNLSKFWILVNKFIKFVMPLYTDAYMTCSTEAAKYMFPKRIFKNRNYIYVRNGIETEKFRYNEKIRAKIRQQIGCENAFIVGTVGRLSKQKNQMFLLEVFGDVVKKKKNSILLLIGIGDLKEKLIAKADELGIREKVIFFWIGIKCK